MTRIRNDIYNERIVLITGTTRGIGRYLAECFLEKKAVVCGLSRSAATVENEHYHHYQGDVVDIKDVKRIIKGIRKKFGRLDIVINNAGIASMNTCILMPEDTVKKIFEVNLIGTFNVSRESAKIMIKQKYGRIINFSTVAVPMQIEGESIYASSKAAVEEFSKILAREIAVYGITVNVVGPSPIWTNMIANVSKKKIQELVNKMPLKRLGDLRDIENVVDFFASEKSDFITGQVVYLGGIS